MEKTTGISQEEKALLIKAIQEDNLDQDQKDLLISILETLNKVCSTLTEKRASIQRLRNILGIKTEKVTPKSTFDDLLNTGQKKSQNKVGSLRMGISPFLSQINS